MKVSHWRNLSKARCTPAEDVNGVAPGYTTLLNQNRSAPMYVSEVFELFGGKVQMIDKIGLKMGGMQAICFPD